MLDPETVLTSEDDVRTKLVAGWLAAHGFTAADISVEKSFEIRLGRAVFRVHSGELMGQEQVVPASTVSRPRADILVRALDGRNLLIIEVKASDEPLGEDDREQAISYARLLREGGIAPFAILTNGLQTQIYDVLTRDRIDGELIPPNHPHVQAGFRITGDDITLRAEALQALVSLSSANLLRFCEAQASYRMARLRSTDVFSGKKYIPALFVERRSVHEKLQEKLSGNPKVVLLYGPPQQGKTCFMCRFVEDRLRSECAVLFYPALELYSGLISAIQEDFSWVSGDSSAAQHVFRRLNMILERTSQRLVIAIDGWNEPLQQNLDAVDQDIKRLTTESANITVLLSLTNTWVRPRLTDCAGNLYYVGDAAGLKMSDIAKLDQLPGPDASGGAGKENEPKQNTVYLGCFEQREAEEAFSIYRKAYSVIGGHRHADALRDPFLLRLAMEYNSGKKWQKPTNEADLIRFRLCRKFDRCGCSTDSMLPLLSGLAERLLAEGAPMDYTDFKRMLDIPAHEDLPARMLDGGFLRRISVREGSASIDFYEDAERWYAIAFLARDWRRRLADTPEVVREELRVAGQSQVGVEALEWFLRLPANREHVLKVIQQLPCVTEDSIKELALSVGAALPTDIIGGNLDLLRQAVDSALREPNPAVRAEASELIIAFGPAGWSHTHLSDHQRAWVRSVVEVLADDRAYYSVADTLVVLHLWTVRTPVEPMESSIVNFILCLLDDSSPTTRSGAILWLADRVPHVLVRRLPALLGLPDRFADDLLPAVERASCELASLYYGSPYGCPGFLDSIESDGYGDAEYNEWQYCKEAFLPFIFVYYAQSRRSAILDHLVRVLTDILIDLQPPHEHWLSRGDIEALKYQLRLPLGDC